MRLTPEQHQIIKEQVKKHFGSQASVILFGSRTDDTLRGGDIDLLIELENPVEHPVRKNLSLNADLQIALGGPQKIDIITHNKSEAETPIYKQALKEGIRL